MVEERIRYLCSICKTEYPDIDRAVSCEANGFEPFKFQIRQHVSVISKGDMLTKGQHYFAEIVQQYRRLEWNGHQNWYEVEFIGHPGVHGSYQENEIKSIEY